MNVAMVLKEVQVPPRLLMEVMSGAGLTPLIATGPAYVSADTVFERVNRLHLTYGRAVALNLIAGAERSSGAHQDRYKALSQFYGRLSERFSDDNGSICTNAFAHKRFINVVSTVFVAGHSENAEQFATKIEAINLRILPQTMQVGLRARSALNFGIIIRPSTSSAWDVARKMFPDRVGSERVLKRIVSTTDSQWKTEVLTNSESLSGYWTIPAKTMRADSPFFVGSYEELASLISSCKKADVKALILDLPPVEPEYVHLKHAIGLADTA